MDKRESMWGSRLAQFGSDLHQNFIIVPGGRSSWLLMVVGLEHQMARCQQDFPHLRILANFFPGGGDNELIMFTRGRGLVWQLFFFECYPVDAHFFHVL